MRKKVFALLRTFLFAALVPTLSFSLFSCEPVNGVGGSTGGSSDEQDKFLIYENLGSFNWTYLIVEDADNLLLVNDDDGKFVSSYGIFSHDTVFILSDLAEGTLSIDVNNEVVEIVCSSDSVIVYSKDGRESYSLREAISRTRAAVSNGDMLNVLFGKVIGEIIPDFISKPVELMKYLYETDNMDHHEKIDYKLDGDYELIPADWLDDLFDWADDKENNHKSTPLYYIGIKTGTADVKGSSATCYVEGYLRIDGNGAPCDFEYGICYSTSSMPTVEDNVQCKREVNGLMSSFSLCLPDSFVCSHLESEAKYYYRAYFKDNLTSMIDYADEIKEFATAGICNDANHVHAVDLGLSVKWACCNVGASSPEGYGGYYAWGETEEKSNYGWDCYKWGDMHYMTKYCTNNIYGIVDNKTTLEPEDDVAHVKWGDSWRMPTFDEIEELYNKCSWEWARVNGVEGYKVTGPNGNRIFLPAAGYRWAGPAGGGGYGTHGDYWSSTLYDGRSQACDLYFNSGYWNLYSNTVRSSGLSVRPVSE